MHKVPSPVPTAEVVQTDKTTQMQILLGYCVVTYAVEQNRFYITLYNIEYLYYLFVYIVSGIRVFYLKQTIDLKTPIETYI